MASLDPADKALIIKRLKRAQGQMGGIIRMLEEERACRDVVTQLAAVSKAIDRAGFALIASGLKACASADSTTATASMDTTTTGTTASTTTSADSTTAATTSTDAATTTASADAATAATASASTEGDGTGVSSEQPCLTVAELEKLFLSLA